MSAYYNEIDPYAAQWLRNLIAAGHIAPGEVDECSIADVRGDDLRGFTQCHFFAGIGVWSYALRLAGWPDEREVWTGSCPCQPFSAAGKGDAYADERHLWPHWHRLIGERRPATIFGEQVDAAIRSGWLDDVCLSLEALGYAVGAVDFPACSVGAPHIRQRLYFVAESDRSGRQPRSHGRRCHSRLMASRESWTESSPVSADALAVADAGLGSLWSGRSEVGGAARGSESEGDKRERIRTDAGHGGDPDELGDASHGGRRIGDMELHGGARPLRPTAAPSATNGFWSDAEWIACRDGKARPAKPGVFPLAHGAAQRVGQLRAYGNCIVAPQAAEFIRAYLD